MQGQSVSNYHKVLHILNKGHNFNIQFKMNIYHLIYYRIYKATYRTNKSVIEWSSMIALSVLIYFNFISLVTIIDQGRLSKDFGEILFKWSVFGILYINYLIFIRDKRYLNVVSEFSQNKKANSFTAGILILSYVILSPLLFLKLLGVI